MIEFLVLGRFPAAVREAVSLGVVGRGMAAGCFAVGGRSLSDWGRGKHQKIDHRPFGGGSGLVLRADVVIPAIRWARSELPQAPVILLSPQGAPAQQHHIRRLAQPPGAIFLCGRYEGFDERIRAAVDLELSVGDFILSGGELAAACLIDAAARLIPGVLGSLDSCREESHADGLLEYPHYTQPTIFEGEAVPEVLRSGDHGAIARWRQAQAETRTEARRPDLYDRWSEAQRKK